MERQSEKPEPRNSRKKPHPLRQTGEWKTNRVGATGFEQPPFHSGKPEGRNSGGAECGARAEASPLGRPRDPLLRLVVRRWQRLTAEQCLAIIKIATAQERSSAVPRKAPRSAARRILDFGQGAGGKD